jgi:hypothetical protein
MAWGGCVVNSQEGQIQPNLIFLLKIIYYENTFVMVLTWSSPYKGIVVAKIISKSGFQILGQKGKNRFKFHLELHEIHRIFLKYISVLKKPCVVRDKIRRIYPNRLLLANFDYVETSYFF